VGYEPRNSDNVQKLQFSMTQSKVVTRFAPSPTGFLHIGGARTALFNWLFARRHGGKFRLRIEDTDSARSTSETTQAILNGMAWLGLNYDGDVVYQSRRADQHTAVALHMLEKGAAYRCYCTSEELEDLRKQYREQGIALRSPWRDASIIDTPDRPYTVRFRVPDGQTSIHDQVQGGITWENDQFDDLVLLRTDGTPTYMLAVVVDDHNMGVTHIIRGDDHLINAGKQSLIYKAMGWDISAWAHLPLIHGPDGKKLSKRHGAPGVEAYRDMGYTASGLRNYLLKLGWSHGDQEVFLGDEAQHLFDLGSINAAPARLDSDKMGYINGQHVMAMDDDRFLADVRPFIKDAHGKPLTEAQSRALARAVKTLKPRTKNFRDAAAQVAYILLERPYEITGKAAVSLKKSDVIDHLDALILDLDSIKSGDWSVDTLHDRINFCAERHSMGFGKIGQPVRAALTAGHPAPDLSQVLFVLGRNETLARLRDAVRDFGRQNRKERGWKMKSKIKQTGTATLIIENEGYDLPVYSGSMGPPGIDVRSLYKQTGHFTFDPGYTSTCSAESQITFTDGSEGQLLYRGYPIEQLAEESTFLEVAYLLINGELPDHNAYHKFEKIITRHTMLHDSIEQFFRGFRRDAHPMAMMCGTVGALSGFYHDDDAHTTVNEARDMAIYRLIAKIPTIAARAYKYSIGQPRVYPNNSLSYAENFMHMCFSVPAEKYRISPVVVRAIDKIFILHADHEQNASTSTVRMAGSSGANPYACIAAGIACLWGPSHGGANEACLNMLREIGTVDRIPEFIARAKDRFDPFRLMGFGHRVYKNFDPRSRVMQKVAHEVLDELDLNDPILNVAKELEKIALEDEYFAGKKLYPNVDFYSGIVLNALGFPTSMFTVLFALARTVGWISQWNEMLEDPGQRIGRPRQLYSGATPRDYVPVSGR